MTAPLFIFTHIPKTAGSTMAKFLRGEFRRSEMLDVTPLPQAEIGARIAAAPESIRLVIGHARHGLHCFTSRPCRYFTILRDPIERTISAYSYIRRKTDHRWHERVRSGELDLAGLARLQADLQTKYVAGTPPGAEVDDAEFARAKEHLVNDYLVAGLVERFEESILLLATTQGWRCPSVVSENVTRGRARREALSAETLAIIEECNRYDRRLHDLARTRLEEKINAQPAGFAKDLTRFRRRVRWLNWRNAPVAHLRRWLRPARLEE